MTAECMRKLVLVSAARRLRRSAAEQAAGEASNCEVLLQDVLAVEAEEALAMAGARHCLSTPAPPRQCCAVSRRCRRRQRWPNYALSLWRCPNPQKCN